MTDAVSKHRIAAIVAEEAGGLLLAVRAAGGDPKQLGKEGDSQANDLILRRLAELRPGDSVLSEEAADDKTRLEANRVWIVDPLDGTREFGLPPRTDWAVHVALWERGRGLTAGAVAMPALTHVWATDDWATDDWATDDWATGDAAAPLRPVAPPRAKPLILVSDSRPPAFAGPVAAAIGGEVATMGSAGAKAMAVLRGDADAYLHSGGQWEWDSAAPVAVLQAAGFHASRIDGSDLIYNQAHPYLPDLLICRPQLAASLLAAIAEKASVS